MSKLNFVELQIAINDIVYAINISFVQSDNIWTLSLLGPFAYWPRFALP